MALSLRSKLLVLIAVPLAMVAAMGAMLILSSMGDKGEIDDAESNLTIMKSLSSLLSAAQDERGIAYLYLSGTAAADRIMSTRNGTGSSWETVQAALAAVPAPESLETVLTSSVARFQQLRRQVDERSMMAQSAYTGYSELIDLVMAEYVALSATNAAEASRQLQSIVYLEKAKENAARIQCLASSIFSLDLAIQYTKTIELVDTNAGIAVNLANAGEYCGELASVSLSELEISPEWYELQDAVLSILGNAQYGGYGRDGLALYNATEPVMDKIQATIDIVMAETDAWFAERSALLTRRIVLIAGALGAAALVVLVVSLLILSNVASRMKEVSEGMRNVASGDADLTLRVASRTQDELGALAGFFNGFAEKLAGIIDRIKAEVGSLGDGMVQLASNTEETAGAIRQITANIESLKLQSINQSASVTESSATVEQIARNIEQLYRLIERQSEGVSSSSSSIEQMVASIQSVTANIERMGSYYDKLLGKSDAGRGAIATVVAQVREIDSQSENLQAANQLIAGIAAETNLLAMNAAIEAAHAGEAGMGFAVVADEIRKLAENAAVQSKTIGQTIKGIRGVIEAVVASSGQSASTFEEILEQIRILSRLEEEVKYSMQEQSAGSSQILESLASINEVTADVRHSAQEMQEGSNAVLTEMRQLLQLASELENGMSEMASGAEEIRRAAQDTNELTIAASASVKNASAEVAQFKT